jgi:S-methylmethionine-dependent homocysteine/selenocysteine methylase
VRAITDGGLETTLIYHYGADLPDFAAFVLLDDNDGIELLRRYYAPYVEVARTERVRAILDTPTWRANSDWGARLGYDAAALADVNRRAVELLDSIRLESADVTIAISGCIGPRGDGYVVGAAMTAAEAETCHAPQVRALGGADVVSAITMTYPAEAVGIVRAAAAAETPVVISFTVETDGRLPNGQSLADAVAEVDGETGDSADYFMVNCAHPSHFEHVLPVDRVRGVRANASKLSHAQLDVADELDEGDPAELARDYASLSRLLTLEVVGGCCGTDHRHVGAIAAALSDS